MSMALRMSQNLSNRILTLRAIQRRLNNPDFQIIYDGLRDEDRSLVDAIIASENHYMLAKWFKAQKKIENQGIRDLRAKARKLGIRRWYELDKHTLLREINNGHCVQDGLKENSRGINI